MGLDRGPRHQVETHCDGKVTAVRTKTERRAARAPEAAYHEVRLADLRHVAEKLGRYRAGEVDGYAVDEAIHHYDQASQELWKFCWSGCVGATTEIVAMTLEQLTEDGQMLDWWERIPSRQPDRLPLAVGVRRCSYPYEVYVFSPGGRGNESSVLAEKGRPAMNARRAIGTERPPS